MYTLVDVAVPGPFRSGLRYLGAAPLGCRVKVPLRTREVVGVVIGVVEMPLPVDPAFKAILEVLDETPLFDASMRDLLQFVSSYYHASLGDVYATALPKLLCDGKPLQGTRETKPKAEPVLDTARVVLNAAQHSAIEAILVHRSAFSIHLLEGVTGSGKTEVYLALAQAALDEGKTVLVLVPEIGLTPQTLARFEARFGRGVAAYHSELTETQKRQVWRQALAGEIKLVVGTRSAIFLPLQALGLIILDEEHDASYKQQTGVPYSAKSVALRRAQDANCPVVLGSATPALESLHFMQQQRYLHHRLTALAKGGAAPTVRLIDMRSQRAEGGLSRPLIEAMHKHLAAGHQVLIFLNRRGFAPILLCNECGERVQCPACEMSYTVHQHPQRLVCHHCGREARMPAACGGCRAKNWAMVGTGTEQIESLLEQEFAGSVIVRLDQDVTRKKGELARKLAQIHTGEAQIIVGTQMLSKGHDFTRITLVGIVDLDYGFFSPDFRGMERMGQLLTQVSGRAGRALLAGEVLIQTRVKDHPLLQMLLTQGYHAFAEALLLERKEAFLPPFQYLAMFRAEHRDESRVLDFLTRAKQALQGEAIRIHGPMASALRKRAGRYRAQLLLESPRRPALHQALNTLEIWLSQERGLPKYALDVDPLEVI